ncbi:LPS export ABC transporter periplasmic protein LptC [uncultured Croceitalea sp.]|uniref:LPS export ABC transporter periplasmic protein LptC n=1 Tax=uncultured Croceitalea sp. TaxID=1798908 RepID=UPI003306121D
MPNTIKNRIGSIATVFTVAILFMACQDNYKRVGEEAATNIYPEGIAKNFTLTYTETIKELNNQDSSASRVIAVLKGPLYENYENLSFKHQIFPEGLLVDFYDDDNKKSIIKADYGIVYSDTNLIDLQGNVVLESHDGKKLEAPQLYWDRSDNWIFTEATFKYTNPEDGTIMDGEGMDFNRDFTFFNAHKTYGLMTISEEE